MLSLALYPLALYFFVLALFYARRRPTLLTGWADFMLLAFGISGLLSLGIGRLVIPLKLIEFWGLGVWIHWALLYYLIACSVAWRLPPRTVIYHCSLDDIAAPLQKRLAEIDPDARWDRHFLSLPSCDCQVTITGDALGGHLLLQAVHSKPNKAVWGKIEQEFQTIRAEVNKRCGYQFWCWAGLAGALATFATYNLAIHFSEWKAVFIDYWL